ncbi:GNAT family N-acetyltransferase [Domibacillus indicus]|uniref:GNAT family N-acetyltransferase n=1 Tax=Domibacillus indicus TaxID=1437523 RepID=UPI0006180B40|nr:GNAT family N-acetyltransferase [Domibacillus indicus]
MIGKAAACHLLTVENRDGWNKLVKACETPDVFFLADYLALYEQRGEGSARLFVYEESSENFALYPYLLREIPEAVQGKSYFDIVTPYGYGGPLYSHSSLQKDGGFVQRFRKAFSQYCQSEGIVSEFVRFHPYLNNDKGLEEYMLITPVGDIVYNNLEIPEEQIWENIASSKKRRIKKAKKNDVDVLFVDGKDITPEDVTTFHSIYTETMDKKNASPFYYFSRSFFQSYFRVLAPCVTLAYAVHSGRIISVNLILAGGEFATIHLSASLKEFLPLCPNCYLRYECILWAKKKGYRFIDHGGGKEKGDSLFAYKRQFSNSLTEYKVGKKIHLDHIYEALSARLPIDREGEQAAFFPEYRMMTG